MDGTTEMSQTELRAYARQQKKLARAAELELEQRRQMEATQVPRPAKAKALGNKIWLPGKRPGPGDPKEPVVQKKIKSSNTSSKANTMDVEEKERAHTTKSGPIPPKTRARLPAIVESDSSSMSELSSDDDDDVAGEDDDLRIKSMTDEQLEEYVGVKKTSIIDRDRTPNSTNDAQHLPPPSLFDISDSEVQMAPSRAPSRASSHASGPPTSDFEDPLVGEDGNEDSDNHVQGDSDESDIIIPPRRSKPQRVQQKGKQKISKHGEKFEREQPKIKTQTTDFERNASSSSKLATNFDKSDADDDAKWPVWTHINFSPKSKRKVLLLEQHQVIRAVVRHAFELADIDIITRLAWPELETSRETYRRQILHRAAKDLQKKDVRAKEVKERVKGSTRYSSVLGDLVMDRLSINRSPARTSALSHIAYFELGVGATCQQRVTALMDNDLYIYPGTWQIREHDERNEKTGNTEKRRESIWVISDRSMIYQNPGFMDSLKDAFFDKRGSFGFKYIDYFKSTLQGREEPELTIPIVALGATGFYAALHGWSTGNFNKKEKFEGEIFNTVFERHVKYLEQIKEDNHIAFHVILSRLYTYVTKDSAAKTNSMSNALGVADLSGYE